MSLEEAVTPARGRLARGVGRLGALFLRRSHGLLLFAALAARVAMAAVQRDSWPAPVRAEFRRALHEVNGSFATAVATGMLLGLALVSQAIYWLEQTGTTATAGPLIVNVLVRQLVPVMAGLIVFGRNGTTTVIELGESTTRRWLHLFRIQGMDPALLVAMPRAIAFSIGTFCLGTVLLVTTLLTGFTAAQAFNLIAYPLEEFVTLVARALTVNDFIVPPLKCLLIGYLVALTCWWTSSVGDETSDLRRLVPRAFVRCALAVLAVSTVLNLA